MRLFSDVDFHRAGNPLDHDALIKRLDRARRKRRYAYLAWLCFGSHYLYLRRPAVQALFWLTLGGLLIWWLIDLRRIPALVKRQNLCAAEQFHQFWHEATDHRRAEQLRSPTPWATREADVPEAAPTPRIAESLCPPGNPDFPIGEQARRRSRTLAGCVFAGALLTAASLYAFAPPPLYSRALLEPSFRTVRAVNVRASPSTASPVRAVIGEDAVLKGRIEQAGSTQWLWITRGAHADGYVALRNLKRL